ncbi:hypothetical protein [Prevotella pectinovora]|uniref:hypothetical protein n=1 Tax=Prevotella pectinovora TaxID=1602169 RepID=UPI003A8DC7B1
MIQIIQKEQEITNMFLEDTAQGDWVIKLGKADFEKVSIGRKPIIAVKAEDDKSIGELSEIAFDEIKKTGCKPAYFIVILSYRQDEELMMMELAEFNDCLSTYIDNNTDFKWGVQSVSDMPYKRRITIIAFAQNQLAEDKEKNPKQENYWRKLSREISERNKAKRVENHTTSSCPDINSDFTNNQNND